MADGMGGAEARGAATAPDGLQEVDRPWPPGGRARSGTGPTPRDVAADCAGGWARPCGGRRGRGTGAPAGRAGRAAAAFAAGAAGVLTAHQAALWALHRAGWAPWPAYSLAPTRPLGVPAVASAAFWGGAWWAALAPRLPRARGPGAYYGRAALLGAALPNAVGALLLALGRGRPPGGAGPGAALCSAVLVNGLWGAASAALLGGPGRAPGR